MREISMHTVGLEPTIVNEPDLETGAGTEYPEQAPLAILNHSAKRARKEHLLLLDQIT